MAEWGVWSDACGGFVATQLFTRREMERELDANRAGGDRAAKLLEICPDHSDEEQPRVGCEICNQEPDEDEAA